jgi:hypothetical protein
MPHQPRLYIHALPVQKKKIFSHPPAKFSVAGRDRRPLCTVTSRGAGDRRRGAANRTCTITTPAPAYFYPNLAHLSSSGAATYATTHVHVHDTAHAYIASQEREGCTNTLLHHRVFIHTCPYIHEFTSPVLFERRSKGFLFWLLLISWLCTPTLFKSRLFMSLVLTLKSCTK